MTERTVYLDHAATTPMVPAAVEAMTAHLLEVGNPSSLHASGRHARRVVEESRETIAQALDCRPGEVVFTSGGTEADNLALKGIYWARLRRGPAPHPHPGHRDRAPRRARPAATGCATPRAPRSSCCRSTTRAASTSTRCARRSSATRTRSSLVSVMWANNEVGTLQPVDEVVAIAAEHGIPVHTDAVQAVGAVPVDFAASRRRRADPHRRTRSAAPTASARCRAPRGRGHAARARRRPGARHPQRHHRHPGDRRLRRRRRARGQAAGRRTPTRVGGAARRPGPAGHRGGARRAPARRAIDPLAVHRLPGNAHLGFPGCEGDSLLMLLDARGIECSTGSACSAGVPQPSHVLLAMGCDDGGRAALAALLARPHLHPGRRRRGRRGDRPGRRTRAGRRRPR